MWYPNILDSKYYSDWWQTLEILALFWRISQLGQDWKMSGEMVTALFSSWGLYHRAGVASTCCGYKYIWVVRRIFFAKLRQAPAAAPAGWAYWICPYCFLNNFCAKGYLCKIFYWIYLSGQCVISWANYCFHVLYFCSKLFLCIFFSDW